MRAHQRVALAVDVQPGPVGRVDPTRRAPAREGAGGWLGAGVAGAGRARAAGAGCGPGRPRGGAAGLGAGGAAYGRLVRPGRGTGARGRWRCAARKTPVSRSLALAKLTASGPPGW